MTGTYFPPTPSGSTGLLAPLSSTSMLLSAPIPNILITSPPRSLSPGVSRLGESTSTLLQEEPILNNQVSMESTPAILLSNTTSPRDTGGVLSSLIISPLSTSPGPYLFGNQSTLSPTDINANTISTNFFNPNTSMIISPTTNNSTGTITSNSNIGTLPTTTLIFVRELCSKVLNNKFSSGIWESFISWDEEDTRRESFHTFFQPTLSEMDPALILERIEPGDKSLSISINGSKATSKLFSISHPSNQGMEFKDMSKLTSVFPTTTAASSSFQVVEKTKTIPRSLSFLNVLDKFNVSGDKHYQSKDSRYGFPFTGEGGLQTDGTHFGSNIALIHSIPALKLTRPFYKAWMTKSELRAFHRYPFGIRYAPRILFKKVDKLFFEDSDSLPHFIHATAIIPRSIKDLTLVPGSGSLLSPTMLLIEYCEECPVLIQNEGMGSLLYCYTRESSSLKQQSSKIFTPTTVIEVGFSIKFHFKLGGTYHHWDPNDIGAW